MAPGTEYALGAMVFFGVGDLIYKRGGAAGARPHHLLMLQSWVFLPAVAAYGLLTGSLTFVAGTLWGCLAGLFMWLGFYNFAYSLRTGSISVIAPIFRLSFVITAALAMGLLGEPLTGPKLAGIALALVATWLLLAAPAGGTGAERTTTAQTTNARTASEAATNEGVVNEGVVNEGAATEATAGGSGSSLVRVLIATVAVGVGNLIYKYGLRAGATPASLIVAQAAVVVTFGTAFVAAVDGRVRPSGVVLRYAPAAAVVLAIAFALMVESLARGDASVMIPIAQMGFTVTALLGFLLLREPFTLRKGAGLITALAALAAFALA